MCLVLLTTAHPSYSIIILNNRDEFVSRPTSRPCWWSSHGQEILSSRDLLKEEQGTWLGITKKGSFAVLTNFSDSEHKTLQTQVMRENRENRENRESRGSMVIVYLTRPEGENTEDFAHRILNNDEKQKKIGGFSLLTGRLKRVKPTIQELEPLAIISNRTDYPRQVSWIAGKRGEAYGLSNTSFSNPEPWPKVRMGKEKLLQIIKEASAKKLGKYELVEELFSLLNTDTFPTDERKTFEGCSSNLKDSIFIPPIGTQDVSKEIASHIKPTSLEHSQYSLKSGELKSQLTEIDSHWEIDNGVSGVYGTQRQTVILVDWEGNVTFCERSLWDADGQPIQRGESDLNFEFKIED